MIQLHDEKHMMNDLQAINLILKLGNMGIKISKLRTNFDDHTLCYDTIRCAFISEKYIIFHYIDAN